MEKKTKSGIESLLEAVKADCSKGNNCFNANGCDKERYLYLPEVKPGLLEAGVTTKCVANTKCMHDYCGKFKWVMERADMYAKLTGKTREEVVEAWEKQRTYWYMNFYQESRQPEIKSKGMKVVLYDKWIKSLQKKFGNDSKNWKFKCPSCKNVQSGQDFIDAGVPDKADNVYQNCIGRYVSGKGCDWTLGGLFQIHKTIVVKDMQIFPVFEISK